MTSTAKGCIAAVASAVCYGMNPLGALFLYQEEVNTDSALFYRFFLASLLLGITMLIQKESFKITQHEFPFLVSLGLMFATSSLSYYDSFHYMDAGISSTLLFVYPIMVAIIMAIFFHEKLTIAMSFSIFIAMAGVGTLYYGKGMKLDITGVSLVMISSLSYAIYMVIVNRAKLQLSAVKLTFYATLFCASFIFVHSCTTEANHIIIPYSASIWLYAFILAIFPGVLSLYLMAIAVRHIGSTRTAIFGALEPVTALSIGILVFGEQITSRIILGVILILSAVILIIVSARKQKPTHKD